MTETAGNDSQRAGERRVVDGMRMSKRFGVTLETPSASDEAEFLQSVRRSRTLHHGWVAPPKTPEQYRRYLRHNRSAAHIGHLVRDREGSLVGVINISNVVRGS